MRYNTTGFSEEQLAVLPVAETFLSGIGARDKNLMLAQILPSGGATLLRNGSPLFTTLGGVAQPTILVDRDLAMAWTPYEFSFDTVIDHVGTDIWSFTKLDGRWFISTLADDSYHPPTTNPNKYESFFVYLNQASEALNSGSSRNRRFA
ncbi:hypothetical protein C8R44DRAFT_978501 [Mycena epipterygia]|nr:hypothetical protein C8R44DRAFT_978501 [Mycena epipterygia]